MQPFDKHPADPGALQAAGEDLINQGAQAIQTGQSTRQAYQPAIPSVTGDPAPAIAAASQPVDNAADTSASSLVWASVATQYWGSQVQAFNTEVDRIVAALAAEEASIIAKYDAMNTPGTVPGGGMPPAGTAQNGQDTAEAMERIGATMRAREEWQRVYQQYVVNGGQQAQSMLAQGPTAFNQNVARNAGVMPPMHDTLLDNLGQRTGARFLLNPTLNQGGLGLAGYGLERGFNAAGYIRDYWKSQNLKFQPRADNGRFVNRAQWTANTGLIDRYRAYGSDKNWVAKPNQAATWARWSTYTKVAGRVSPIVSAGTGAVDQWTRDAGRTDIDNGERVARAAGRGAANAAGAAAGAWAGAKIGAIGGAFFGPVGAAVGGVGGAIVGGIGGAVAANYATDEVLEGT